MTIIISLASALLYFYIIMHVDHNTHIKAKQQQSAPATTNVPFTSKPYGKQHIANSSSRAKSTSAGMDLIELCDT